MNNDKKLVIIRSRFQPFTKFHTATIKQAIDNNQQVALCIIRDYETVSRFYSMSPNVDGADLRHLPIFNPFSSWEISFHVHSCLLKEFSQCSIPIIISPLKFSELIKLLTSNSDKAIPQDLENYTNEHKCDEKSFKECIIKENLGRIISNIFRDNIPSVYDFWWLFGMFDLEDKQDFNLASKHTAIPPKQYNPPKIPTYKIHNLTPDLGLYGQFMLWIYMQFVDGVRRKEVNGNLRGPRELKNKEFLKTEIDKLEAILKDYVNNGTEFQNYQYKVSEMLKSLYERFEEIPAKEREVLLNFNSFITLANTSIKVLEQNAS